MHYLYRYVCILNVFFLYFFIYVYGQLSAIKNLLLLSLYANRQALSSDTGSRLTGYIVNVMRSPVIERLIVRCSQVALKHVIHDMEARTLVMELRRRAIKRWVSCDDMDRRLKIPHLAKAECGLRTTPKECQYDSGPIGPSV